ncbi:MAG: DUF5908 family protein [Bacteroidota bacterium]
MPIEIRELYIKAVVNDPREKNPDGAEGNSNMQGQATVENTEQVIELCVEKVLDVLRERTER